MGEFHDAAPPGMVVDVVVCSPFIHVHSTVSPIFTMTPVEGENAKFETVMIFFVALEEETKEPINNKERKEIRAILL